MENALNSGLKVMKRSGDWIVYITTFLDEESKSNKKLVANKLLKMIDCAANAYDLTIDEYWALCNFIYSNYKKEN